MAAKTSLNMVAFTYTPNASGTPPAVTDLARLKTFSASAENDQKDGGGMATRFPYFLNVKQGQTIDFTVFANNAGSSPPEPILTNLDISVYTEGGTSYLGQLRSATIEVTTVNKEASGIASAYKSPGATRTQVQFTAKKLILTNAVNMPLLINGVVGNMDVTVVITFGTWSFSMPMTIKSGKHTVDREELQMEDVVFTAKGTATGPSDNSLLGNILLGTSQVGLALDTGGGQYNTGTAMWALITKLTVKFDDGDLIEQTGQFQFQGAAVWATG